MRVYLATTYAPRLNNKEEEKWLSGNGSSNVRIIFWNVPILYTYHVLAGIRFHPSSEYFLLFFFFFLLLLRHFGRRTYAHGSLVLCGYVCTCVWRKGEYGYDKCAIMYVVVVVV